MIRSQFFPLAFLNGTLFVHAGYSPCACLDYTEEQLVARVVVDRGDRGGAAQRLIVVVPGETLRHLGRIY